MKIKNFEYKKNNLFEGERIISPKINIWLKFIIKNFNIIENKHFKKYYYNNILILEYNKHNDLWFLVINFFVEETDVVYSTYTQKENFISLYLKAFFLKEYKIDIKKLILIYE